MKNTACKSRTINPVWKETFVLDVSEDLEEVLHVDVWNFMPDEKLREKLRKINDVRDSKGTFLDTIYLLQISSNFNQIWKIITVALRRVRTSLKLSTIL